MLLSLVLLFLSMGRRGKTAEQESAPWMQASRDRLAEHRAIRGDAASGVDEETFVELGSRPRKAIAAGEPVAPAKEKAEWRTTEEVMAMVHRGGDEGLRASGWSPDRHTVYVCGRPVQVFRKSHESLIMTSHHILNLSICL